MLLRTTRAFAMRLFGAGLFLAACAAPEPSTLRGSGSGSALKLGGKGQTADEGDESAACAPSDASGTGGTGPRDFACTDVTADPPPAAAATPAPAVAAQPLPIKASLSVTRHPDGASMNNCLKIQVNGGPLVDLGCNHGTIVGNVQIDALPKPACNVVRLILFSNGQMNRTTQSADNVARDFLIQQTAQNGFAIQCNDNGDDDFNDLNLDIASADANLAIENTGLGCSP